jgi:hypothetical protein
VWSVPARLFGVAVLAVAATSVVTASGSPFREASAERKAAGYALSLNGASAYVSVPDSRSLQLERTGAFTVAFRVLLHSYSNNLLPRFWEKGPQYLCVMGDPTNPRFRTIALEVQNSSFGGNSNGGATEYWGSTKLVTERWYSVAVTFDQSLKSSQAQIYLDGAPEKMTTIYPWSGTLFATAGKPFEIGRRTNDMARMLDGVVDSMTVYTSALSPSQIANLAHGKRVAGAVADWEFDEGAGTSAQDTSGHGNTGSVVAGAYVPN